MPPPTKNNVCFLSMKHFFRMRSKGSRFTLGVWGLRVCSLDVAQPFAAVRNRPQPFASDEFCKGVTFGGFHSVALDRFARQAWHFVTFRRVSQLVESGFVWQVQYFWVVCRRCVAVFVAGAALWTCPSSFCVAGAAL